MSRWPPPSAPSASFSFSTPVADGMTPRKNILIDATASMAHTPRRSLLSTQAPAQAPTSVSASAYPPQPPSAPIAAPQPLLLLNRDGFLVRRESFLSAPDSLRPRDSLLLMASHLAIANNTNNTTNASAMSLIPGQPARTLNGGGGGGSVSSPWAPNRTNTMMTPVRGPSHQFPSTASSAGTAASAAASGAVAADAEICLLALDVENFKRNTIDPFRSFFDAAISRARTRIREAQRNRRVFALCAKDKAATLENECKAVLAKIESQTSEIERKICMYTDIKKEVDAVSTEVARARECRNDLLARFAQCEQEIAKLKGNVVEKNRHEHSLAMQAATEIALYESMLRMRLVLLGPNTVATVFVVGPFKDAAVTMQITVDGGSTWGVGNVSIVACVPPIPLEAPLAEFEVTRDVFLLLKRIRREIRRLAPASDDLRQRVRTIEG